MGDPTDASGRFDGGPGSCPHGDAGSEAGEAGGTGNDPDGAPGRSLDSADVRDPDVQRFARRWLRGLTGCACLRMPHDEAAELLRALSARLAAAVRGPRLDLSAAAAVGRSLADPRFNPAEVLSHTLVAVVDGLAVDLGDTLPADQRARVAALTGALAQGFAQALHDPVLTEHEQRSAARTRLEAIFAEAAVGIAVVDPAGLVLDVNPTMAAMIGVPPEQLRGRSVRELVGAGSREVMEHYQDLIEGRVEHFRLELGRADSPVTRADGGLTHLDLSMSMVRDLGGNPDFMIAIALDVSERRRLADQLWLESRHDPLTGLANRVLFFERLADLLDDPRTATQVGLCVLDLDGFKNVNDGLGHDIGDRLLAAVSDRLSEAVAGQGRLLARLGGDEFGMLTDGRAGSADLAQDAQAMLDALVDPIEIAGHQLTVSTSIGIVDAGAAGIDPDRLLRAADITLYEAKAQRKGGWLRYDPERSVGEVNRHVLATEIPSALARDELFLEYQPQVVLDGGGLRCVEALVRWRHPELGLLGPHLFVPLAEETGNAAALGRWVLVEACRQARRWNRDHPGARLGISINVAGRQLREPQFVEDVQAVLVATGLPVDLLRLELTESVLLDDEHRVLDALDALASSGVALVIDDFGTGRSTLSRLNRLPVSELKIAGSFLRSRQASGGTADTIVSAIIGLAHQLGLVVTAERVETHAQVERLRAVHCDAGQGWYFGRPVNAVGIDALLLSGAVAWDGAPTG
jgi:diguanylate cyclase (GGDEF)-like protein/PAS domain S-box-containing protein